MKTAKVANIVGIKPTKSPKKVQLHFTQEIQKVKISALQLANEDDERFGSIKPQHAWMNFEVSNARKLFPFLNEDIDFVEENADELLKENEEHPLGFKHQAVATHDGNKYRFNIRIVETTEISKNNAEWQIANLDRVFKQNGEGDYCVTEEGFGIITNKLIEVGDVDHQYISHAGFTTEYEDLLYHYDGMVCKGSNVEVVEEAMETNSPVIA